MKKALYYSVFVVLLICAAFIYSCEKDSPSTATAPVGSATDESSSTERTNSCEEVMIANGIGLQICGADGASGTSCSLCPSGSGNLTPITANPQIFMVTASTNFTLANNTGSAIRPTVILNCAWPFRQVFNIPAWSTVPFSIVPAGGGCCLVQVCTGGG